MTQPTSLVDLRFFGHGTAAVSKTGSSVECDWPPCRDWADETSHQPLASWSSHKSKASHRHRNSKTCVVHHSPREQVVFARWSEASHAVLHTDVTDGRVPTQYTLLPLPSLPLSPLTFPPALLRPLWRALRASAVLCVCTLCRLWHESGGEWCKAEGWTCLGHGL